MNRRTLAAPSSHAVTVKAILTAIRWNKIHGPRLMENWKNNRRCAVQRRTKVSAKSQRHGAAKTWARHYLLRRTASHKLNAHDSWTFPTPSYICGWWQYKQMRWRTPHTVLYTVTVLPTPPHSHNKQCRHSCTHFPSHQIQWWPASRAVRFIPQEGSSHNQLDRKVIVPQSRAGRLKNLSAYR